MAPSRSSSRRRHARAGSTCPASSAWRASSTRNRRVAYALPQRRPDGGDMRILLLGGSSFLGRHLIEDALRRGHELTLFNRGQTNPGAYPEVEERRGERGGYLAALQGRRWDRVLDTSGYLPADVRRSAGLLAGAAGHYTFISSISVYADTATAGQD